MLQEVITKRVNDLTKVGQLGARLGGASPIDLTALEIASSVQALHFRETFKTDQGYSVAQKYIELQQQQREDLAARAESIAKEQEILNTPIPIDPQVLKTLQFGEFKNLLPENFSTALTDAAAVTNRGNVDALITELVNADDGVKKAIARLIKRLEDRIAELRKADPNDPAIAGLQTTVSNLRSLADSQYVLDNQIEPAAPKGPTTEEKIAAAEKLAAARVGRDPAAQARAAEAAAERRRNQALERLDTAKKFGASQEYLDGLLIEAQNAETELINARSQSADTQDAIALSYFDVAKAAAVGDPVRQAQIAMDQAALQMKQAQGKGEAAINAAKVSMLNAQEQFRQAQLAITEAYFNVLSAQADGDPIRLAQIAVQRADELARNARSEVERLNALAAQINAQHQLRDAMNAVADAQQNIIIALLSAAGDSVAVAQKTLELSREQFARYLRQHPGATVQNDERAANLYIKTIQDQANLQNTILDKQQRDIQFALDTNKISVGQAIVRLQNLLNSSQVDEQRRQDIERQIYQLKQQLSQDLQYNLPENLRLPTLYEARRFTETQASGNSYQDNREINISITSTKIDATEAVQRVTDAINQPSRMGTRTKAY